MKNKMSNREILNRSKTFFTTVLEGNAAHIENVKNNIGSMKNSMELELMHYQLLEKMGEVLTLLLDVVDELGEKEENLTIH